MMETPDTLPEISRMKSHKRWLLYILAGFAFGIIDWYYLSLLAHFPFGSLETSTFIVPLIIGLNYGIWLVPVLLVTIYESRLSHSVLKTALAGALCWLASILSYYLYYTLLLAFWGLPNMDHLLILGVKGPGFWQEWGVAFQKIILNQVIEWLPIAIVGGLIAGTLIGTISNKVKKAVEPEAHSVITE